MKRQTFMKSTLCLLMALVCNVAWAQAPVQQTTAPEDGYYLMYSESSSGNGWVHYDKNLDKKFRVATDVDLSKGLTANQAKFVWKLVNDSENGTFTLQNVGENVFMPADESRNQNMGATTTANLKITAMGGDGNEGKWYVTQTNNQYDGQDLYIHTNAPGGYPNLSYYNGHSDTGSSIRAQFYKVPETTYAINFMSGEELVATASLVYPAGIAVPEDLISGAAPKGYHMQGYTLNETTFTVNAAAGYVVPARVQQKLTGILSAGNTATYHEGTTSGNWYGKLVKNTSPNVTFEVEDQAKSTIGWATRESIARPMLQAGENYIVSLPEGYIITGYTLVTQSTTTNNKDTFKYTTANGLVESELQTTTNDTITVDGLSTNQIEIDLTEYSTDGTNGIMIWDITLNYSYESMPYASCAPVDGKWNKNATWYKIKTGNGYYFRSDKVADNTLNLTQNSSEGVQAEFWCFVGTEADGYKLYNLAKGTTFALGNVSSNAQLVENGTTTFDFASTNVGADYRCLKEHDTANNYLNRNGSSGKLVFWNSTGATNNDKGSALSFEEVDIVSFVETTKSEALNTIATYEEADYYCYSAETIAQAKSAIETVDVYNGALALVEIEEAMNALTATGKGTTGPVAGDYIQLKNRVEKKFLTGGADKATNTEDKTNIATIWSVEAGDDGNVKLKNESTGKYIGPFGQQQESPMVEDGNAAAQLSWHNQESVYAVFKNVANETDKAYGHVNNGNLTGWTAISNNSQWIISKVYKINVEYKFGDEVVKQTTSYVDYGTKFSIALPEDLRNQNYSIVSCKIGDDAIKSFGTSYSFVATQSVAVTVVLDSPFSTEENPKWLSVAFATGGNYLTDKGNGNNLVTAAACDSDEECWMFIGNSGGFKMKSRAGNYVYYDTENSRFKTTSDVNNAATFTFVYNGSFDAWELQRNGSSKCMNQNGGTGVGVQLGEWTKGDSNNPFILEEAELVPIFSIEGIASYTPDSPLTLWYKNAASNMQVSDQWMEYSLPIGNGQFGASIFGGVSREQVQFNEKTLWSGSKDNYATANYGDYENFGSLYIQDISGVFGDDKPVKDYYRQLDLSNATASVHYKSTDGTVTYTREYIASAPDQVVAMRLKADAAGQISIKVTLVSGKPGVRAKTTYNEGTATFGGKLETVTYNALAKVVNTRGTMTTDAKGITVTGADEVLIILGGATDFTNTTATYTNGTADQLPSIVAERVNAAAAKDWNTLYTAHVDDYKEFFDRCNFVLDGAANTMPTDDLIKQYAKRSTGMEDYALMLEQLYFAYGRYLEIGSSRGVDLPSNLQGIWNNSSEPAWNSDIHANINVQMNYWPAEPTNLSELHMPFLNYIINMANSAEWKDIATNPSKANQPRGWAFLTENNIFGGTGSFQKSAYINNAWYVSHLWQHYRYTLDEKFLERAFPAMWSAAMFWMDRLKLAGDGTYVCPNEYSPEHGPNEDGVAHAQQLVWELFSNTLSAVEVLGQDGIDALAAEYKNVFTEDLATLKDRFAKLDKGLTIEQYTPNGETGAWGEGAIAYGSDLLREWKYSNYYAGANGHRHMSHMMCLYPFNQITEGTDFFDAAINSMKLRGDASTGWSMGWKINLWARALDGDHSHDILELALRHHSVGGGGVYYNLYDAHTPFQIDGNFGACAGIAEMLMQSHTEVINILPALPSVWRAGSITGLKAVGNFTVDIEWEGGQACKVVITNHKGQPCYVKCDNLAQASITVAGNPYTLREETEHNGLSCFQIESGVGEEIVIDLSNATQKDKSELESLIAQTQALVDQCYDYYATEAPLQANEPTGAYYVSTNADQNTGGGQTDGAGIAGLVDNTTGTYFHSRWGGTVAVNEPHYIKIDLGNEKTLTSLKFKYVAHSAPDPKTIVVEGSNSSEDGYTTIQTITKAITAVGEEYVSPIINSATPYRYLRFKVTLSERSGYGAKWKDQYLFAMKEFDLMPRLEVPVTTFPDSKLVPAAADAAKEAIVTATTDMETPQTAAEYKASLAALQAKYDELNAAMQSGTLPVLLSLDTDKPFVYKIGIKREANLTNPVLEYDYANTKMVAVKTYDADNKNHGWYFTKGTADNQVFIHPYLGGGDVLASNSLGDGKEKVKGMPKNSQGYTQEWTLHLYNEENGIYNIKPVSTTTNTYFSNNGGWQQKMGFWADATNSPKDGGSQFMFEPITIDGDIWKHCLDAYLDIDCSNIPEEPVLGYLERNETFNTALAAAEAASENEEGMKEAYIALRSAKEALSFNVPVAGKFYRIKNFDGSGYLSGDYSEDSRVHFERPNLIGADGSEPASSIFYFTENKLVAYTTGMYLKMDGSSMVAYTQTAGEYTTFAFSPAPVLGKFLISFNDGQRSFYSATIPGDDPDGAYESNAAGKGQTADNYRFTVEEVTTLPVTITNAQITFDGQQKYVSTLFTPVALEIPEGITAYIGVNEDNYLSMESIEDIIPANTGVILMADEAKTYDFTISGTAGTAIEADANIITGTVAKTVITPDANTTCYVLAKDDQNVVGLYKALKNKNTSGAAGDTSFFNNACKAYIPVSAAEPQAAKALTMRLGRGSQGGTTSIESSELNAQGEQLIYDLQGRRVLNPTKGIYIVNGKKVIVK